MTENREKQKIITSFIDRNFKTDLTNVSELDSESAFYKAVTERLAVRLKSYIENDMDKLFQVLYQIDVKDHLVNQAFDLGEINKVSIKLAELILNREIDKLKYQAKLKKNN